MHIKELLAIKQNKLFIILAAFFITNALVAEFIGVKIFSLEETLGLPSLDFTLFGEPHLGFNLTAGVVLWPVVFVMTDVINEYYGQRAVKFLSYLAIGIILYAFLMVFFAIKLHPNSWWANESGMMGNDPSTHVANMNTAFTKVMGQGLWIILGSMVAFLVGQIVDVYTFHKIKNSTGENKIWLRSTGSTLVSQFIDSFVVLFIAFYIGANWSFSKVMAIGVVNYLYKSVMALILTPVIYYAHHVIDNYLGHEKAQLMKTEANNL